MYAVAPPHETLYGTIPQYGNPRIETYGTPPPNETQYGKWTCVEVQTSIKNKCKLQLQAEEA